MKTYGREPNGLYTAWLKEDFELSDQFSNESEGAHNQHFAPVTQDQIDSAENIMWIIKRID